ncbi:MAG TPA: helix-turn-helix domain-containing protein [Saprospiraceae bacterium]|nr:helix-turn-helix domain-containing protein [Saprospiraceae bacterium]HPI05785.1 helix-turn-helix domain-containing protein [Saprospiraceae bacterium]
MDYAINLRSLLLLIAMLQALVIAGMLLFRGLRRRHPADFLLSGLLFFLACSLIEHFIGFMGVYDYAREQGHDLTFFPFDNPFVYGPLILLYTRALTDEQFRLEKQQLLHAILPVAHYVIHFSIWALPDAPKFAFLDSKPGYFLQTGLDVLFYLITAWYLWQSFMRYNTYRRLIVQEYSNTGQMTLQWLRIFLYAFSAYLIFDFFFNLAGQFLALWYTGWYWLNLTRALLLYYLAATGWSYTEKSGVQFTQLEKRTSVALPENELEAVAQANSKPLFTPAELELRRTALAAYMESAQPWLDPELNLTSLAGQSGLNAVQLSYLINNAFGQNFNDFVNTYRVEAVKQKLEAPEFQHYSLLAIAFESGFNSKATFNRAFKKMTGNAPSRYQK